VITISDGQLEKGKQTSKVSVVKSVEVKVLIAKITFIVGYISCLHASRTLKLCSLFRDFSPASFRDLTILADKLLFFTVLESLETSQYALHEDVEDALFSETSISIRTSQLLSDRK